MKIILPSQIRDTLEPQVPEAIERVWVDADGNFDGDPSDALAYFRWWTPRPILEKVLDAAPQLRWLHTPSAGVDHVLVPQVLERDITLTNSAGVHAIPIAEFVLAMMLDRAKKLPEFHAAQADKQWLRDAKLRELQDMTLLIIGIGGIGQAIAQRAAGFGMRIWGSRRTPQDMPGVERVVGDDGWRDLLPEADYVVVAAPLTPQTRGMIDEAALRAMKSDAYLVNIARGPIIDEAALLTALREGWIGGAALDTFETEPLPDDSPFWNLPNVFVTPHSTGGSPRMHERQIALFLDNVGRYQANELLRNVVDKSAGY